jgi:hypothetical protein
MLRTDACFHATNTTGARKATNLQRKEDPRFHLFAGREVRPTVGDSKSPEAAVRDATLRTAAHRSKFILPQRGIR